MRANTEIVSIERQAGTMPRGRDAADGRLQADDVAERRRHAAGAGGVGAQCERHDPGGDRARPEPEDDPPGTRVGSNTLRGAPYGLRVPTRPVANWSRLVLPINSAPASSSRRTAGADCGGIARRRDRPPWSAGPRRRCCP